MLLVPLSPGDYRLLVEQAPIMIWRTDSQASCDYFNERWLAFTGRTFAQELGDGWSEGVHPEDREMCLRTFLEAFARRASFEMEYRLRRHDGEYRWVFDRGGPVMGPDGSFVGYVGSCVDVTERVEAQAALARARTIELQALSGLLPMCAWCRKVRDDSESWITLEAFVHYRSDTKFTHGMCPDCERSQGEGL
jgi:PAS domain S-box-containing protein